MIEALDTAKQGLLQAERRATDIAIDILKTASKPASFDTSSNTDLTGISKNIAPATSKTQTGDNNPDAAVRINNPSGFGYLIQQFADLRAEQRAFEANAKAFKAADESLGTLIDDLG